MRITSIELLHADGGWRTISYLKLSTDEGLTGWSEFNETVWNPGLTPVLQAVSAAAIGRDPRAFASIAAVLHATLKLAPGGVGCQAVAAVENACIDVAAKAAGVPAWRLLGGAVRERIPVYWSHAGLFRATIPDAFERDAAEQRGRIEHEPSVDPALLDMNRADVEQLRGARMRLPGVAMREQRPVAIDLLRVRHRHRRQRQ